MRHNQWTHGSYEFVLPPLPPEQVGTVGCGFVTMTVDPAVGDEVCVLFKEDPGYAEQYATVMPITLNAHTGAVRTPFGAVAFVVWQVAAGSDHEAYVETFLNPSTSAALVAAAANQSHLKLIIVNNRTSAVTVFVDYENTFGLDELEAVIGNVDGPSEEEFGAAVQYLLQNVNLVDAVRDAAQANEACMKSLSA